MSRPARQLLSQILWFACVGVAQASDPLFSGDEILDVELRGPLAKTVRDTRTPTERPFEVEVDGESWPVDVRARGKSRVELCRFPPLRLDFEPDVVTSGPFRGQDKLKLVTHCRNGAESDDNLLEEYAAYRMFAALSAISHRVRLLRITYVDTSKPKREPPVRYAFAIEPSDSVAERNNARMARVDHLLESRIDRAQAGLLFVFEYLIANVDWSLVKSVADDECCHNVDVLTREDREFLVPHDFDLSGFVMPRYARRVPNIAKRPTRDRAYAGYCLDGVRLEEAIAAISARKAEILAHIEELPWSDAEDHAERRRFLAAFFDEAADPEFAARLAGDCVGG